jgi:hypothetical protein
MGTIKEVLFSPKHAFYKMRRSGGVGGPLLFCISGTLQGAAAVALYIFLAWLAQVLIIVMNVDAEIMWDRVFFALAITFGVLVGSTLIWALTGAIVGAFINAAMVHVCLMIVGGAEKSFETTFRVVCYTMGATMMCNVIPIFGGLISAVANVVILIIGIYAAHETSGGKAVAAVFLPGLILVGILVATVVVLVGLAMAIGAVSD